VPKSPLHEQTVGSASGDLPLHDDSEDTPVAVMLENVVEDTLLDLNQMSPKASAGKMNPLIAVPYLGLINAERLTNRDRFAIFLECPKLNTYTSGCLTRASQIARATWEATQFIHGSLFHNTIVHGT